MDTLGVDMLILIALELDDESLINFCSYDKWIDQKVCKNNTFWMNKLNKKYPSTIGKFPSASDFQHIYNSFMKNVRKRYYLYVSDDIEGYDRPKIFNYVRESQLSDDDYKLAKILYPDLESRNVSQYSFIVTGDLPSGTKIYLPYTDDDDYYIGFNRGYLTKELVVDKIMQLIKNIIKDDFSYTRDVFMEEMKDIGYPQTPEQFYGGSYEEVMDRYEKQLRENDYVVVPGRDDRKPVDKLFPINFTINEVTLP
jgi:hypothetical protein